VKIQLTPQTGSPSTQARRYEATLSRTNDGWKLASLTAVPAGSA
jgi:Mce-associated membrane protein